MSISSSANSARLHFTATSGQTAFSVSFEFFDNADLDVYVNGTQKTITTHYSVSGGDGSTGTVTFNSGLTLNDAVTITRRIDIERVTDFSAGQAINRAALNTQLDTLTAISSDNKDRAERSLRAPDDENAPTMTLPSLTSRKGTVLGFNATSGNVEAGPKIADVSTLAAVTADIATLADIEDGTDATDAIQTVAGIASNVSTVAGVSSAVSTVAGISSNVTAVAADTTEIGAVAGKATEIGRLGTSDAVADLAILGTSDAVSDMNTLAAISSNISTVAGISANVTSVAGVASLITSDFVADLNTLATTDIVSDLNTLATADIVSDLNTLATSDIVSDLNTLATADIVSDLNTLATTDIVSDLNTLATTDIVTDLNLLATSAIVEDLNLLATSTVIADMATLAGAGANPNISSLGVSGTVTAGGLTVDGAATITVTDNSDTLTLVSTDADATVGPVLNLFRNSASPADNDVLGRIVFKGEDSAGNDATFARIEAIATDVTNGSEDGRIDFFAAKDDSFSAALSIAGQNVGIGTSSPTSKFTIGSSSIAAGTGFFQQIQTAGNNMYVGIGSNNAAYVQANGEFRIATGGYADKVTISSAGNVGIGTSSPNIPLEVKGRSADGRFLRGTDNNGTDFVDIGHSGSLGFIDVTHSGGAYHDFAINTGGSERMRLDSSGNVGINDSSPDGKLNVVSTAHNNGSIFDSTGTTQLWLRDTDASSNQKNWGFQVSGGSLNILRANDDRASGFVTPIEIQQAPANSLVINSSGHAIITAGVTIGGTGAANHLDDYEEGTWTPVSDYGTLTSVTATYTKIGNSVFIRLACTMPSTSSSSIMAFAGLPFSTAQDGSAQIGSTNSSNYNPSIVLQGTTCYFYGASAGAVPASAYSGSFLRFTGQYNTTA